MLWKMPARPISTQTHGRPFCSFVVLRSMPISPAARRTHETTQVECLHAHQMQLSFAPLGRPHEPRKPTLEWLAARPELAGPRDVKRFLRSSNRRRRRETFDTGGSVFAVENVAGDVASELLFVHLCMYTVQGALETRLLRLS